jgi:ubiquinone/menaquinone biosynthesis C-methylase UbiE
MSAAPALDAFSSPALPRPRSLREQFGNPTGWVGAMIGRVMSATNAERSMWVLSQLKLEPHHRLLEIGYGPGNDIERVSWVLTHGHVTGIDHSPTMHRMASRRNAAAIERGRVELQVGRADRLPYDDSTFDRLLSINSVQFWPELLPGLREARRVLRPEGLLAIAIQPRHKGASAADTQSWRDRLEAGAREAGLLPVALPMSATRPTPTVCLLATPAP